MTTSTGTVCYDADFYPYGGERVVTNTCPQNYKFTGKERDAETNNDDFGARYYSSQFGRWISPDWSAIPAPVPYANLSNPQTLNLYAMVHDNPETFADLDGHDDNMVQAGKVEVNNQPENPTMAKESQQTNTPPQPAPPVPVPGAPDSGWKWSPDSGNPRGGTWTPTDWKGPGSPPSASYEPGKDGKPGHWDVDSGKGGKDGRQRYDVNGKPITPEQAHGMSSIISNARDFVSAHPVATRVAAGVIIVGGLAAIAFTGGAAAGPLIAAAAAL
jgi:RHS repeat-associated protein